MVVLSSTTLARYMKVYPRFGLKKNNFEFFAGMDAHSFCGVAIMVVNAETLYSFKKMVLDTIQKAVDRL